MTPEIASKLLAVVDAGLVAGQGEPVPGEMCIEAAICYVLGEAHGDQPSCVSPALRILSIGLNDARWNTDSTRASGLRRLALASLGSANALDEDLFITRLVGIVIRKLVPVALREAAAVNPNYRERLEVCAARCERDGDYAADKVLANFAEDVVQLLIEMNAPGAAWLSLT